ncbi:Cyclin Cyclin N terminal domain [Trypanosoma vivax]|uniref:Cyclin n=1 Tax=Trypanosoma vivax (strain Y486) TaxID=1055687 RepID=G0U8S5_TRYVY|nr:cyclin 2 [Trypanosoma vivax]KAH8603449.1 Cyclin Cyclin N terminal domain [Trypanosoma vivax]CCC54006.1 cyclin 2 [Trypanosoma vivax Y486]
MRVGAGEECGPTQTQEACMPRLAQLVAMDLEERCQEQCCQEQFYKSLFHSVRAPKISVWDYMRRIAKYSGCSPECFVVGAIFIDRYLTKTNFPITFRNVHRLVITAMLISAKLRDDIFFSNAYYASIGGVSNSELNRLEINFLETINWCTWVNSREFELYCTQLQSRFSECPAPPGGP